MRTALSSGASSPGHRPAQTLAPQVSSSAQTLCSGTAQDVPGGAKTTPNHHVSAGYMVWEPWGDWAGLGRAWPGKAMLASSCSWALFFQRVLENSAVMWSGPLLRPLHTSSERSLCVAWTLRAMAHGMACQLWPEHCPHLLSLEQANSKACHGHEMPPCTGPRATHGGARAAAVPAALLLVWGG